MALFKNKNGGICEVFSTSNIEKLRKSPNYKEIKEETKNKELKQNVQNSENTKQEEAKQEV